MRRSKIGQRVDSMPPSGSRQYSFRWLIGILIVLSVTGLALLPALRKMAENAERINRQTAEIEAAQQSARKTQGDIDRLRSAVASYPKEAAPHLALAAHLVDESKFDEALPEALAAKRLTPTDDGPDLLVADIYHKTRKYYDAISTYKSLLVRE